MVIQTSMGQHKLDVRYGDRNTLPYYNGRLLGTLLSDADVVAAICAGRCMSVTTAKFLVPGVIAVAGATGGSQPYYAWSGLDANNYPDTYRTNGMPGFLDKPATGIGAPGSPGWPGIPLSATLAGGFATIQHFAAGEFSTTEFDQTSSPATIYLPGTPLTCIAADATGTGGVSGLTNKSGRGLFRTLENTTDVVVAYVAPAAYFVGPEGYPTLAFQPAYIAGTTVPNSRIIDD